MKELVEDKELIAERVPPGEEPEPETWDLYGES